MGMGSGPFFFLPAHPTPTAVMAVPAGMGLRLRRLGWAASSQERKGNIEEKIAWNKVIYYNENVCLAGNFM